MQDNWEDIRVGDIITVVLPYPYYAPQQLTGEVVNFTRIEQIHLSDPLIDRSRFHLGEYIVRIKTNEKYEFPFDMEHRYKEYVIQSHIWNLIDIERKYNMFKVGDKVKVEKAKHSESTPGDVQEFTGKIVHIASGGFLRYLICSEELQEKRAGHDGKTGTEQSCKNGSRPSAPAGHSKWHLHPGASGILPPGPRACRRFGFSAP